MVAFTDRTGSQGKDLVAIDQGDEVLEEDKYTKGGNQVN